MVIPNVGESTRICLQTWMGTYVCAENGGGDLVVVNRPEAKEWEKFGLFIDHNGLVSLSVHNGQFLCAESTGVLMANRNEPKEWEAFRIVDPSNSNIEQTRIEVNVYKIVSAPFWHTGTVIDGREYYFQDNNQVETCNPSGMDLKHHRTMVRIVPGNLDKAKATLESVINRWNGTRYDVAGHNCNFFTDDLIKSLGAPGLDQEYLNASGLAKGLRQVPGGATVQELIVKWPITDKRLDQAFMDDLQRLARLPDDIRKEIVRFFDRIRFPWSW